MKWTLGVILLAGVIGLAGTGFVKGYLARRFPVIIRDQPYWFSIGVIRAMGWQESRWYPGMTPLMLAAEFGQSRVAEELIAMKVSLNVVEDIKGRSGLMIAIYNGHHEVAKHLIEAKADLNILDSKGRKALDYAIEAKNADLIELLSFPSVSH